MMGNRTDQIWAHKGKETQVEEDKVWHMSRAVWHRKGRGGWALWRPQGLGDWTGGLQGGGLRRPRRIRGLRRPWRIRGLRRPWRIRGLRRPWRILGLRWPWRVAPPKKISWGSSPSQGGAQELWKASWTGPAEGKVSWTGPAEVRVSWTGPAWAKVSWSGPAEA